MIDFNFFYICIRYYYKKNLILGWWFKKEREWEKKEIKKKRFKKNVSRNLTGEDTICYKLYLFIKIFQNFQKSLIK